MDYFAIRQQRDKLARLNRLRDEALTHVAKSNAKLKSITFNSMEHYRSTYAILKDAYTILKEVNLQIQPQNSLA